MYQPAWAAICRICQYTKSAPTRDEVVFAIEKHSRLTGHVHWEVVKPTPRAPDSQGRWYQA